MELSRFLGWLAWAAAAVGVFLLLRILGPVLLPFALAWLLAYLIDPLVRWCQRLTKRRWVAATIVLLLLFIIVVIGLSLLLPALVNEAVHFYNLAEGYLSEATWASALAEQWARLDELETVQFDLSLLSNEAFTSRVGAAAGVFWRWFTGLYGVVEFAGTMLATFIYFVFIVVDYPRMSRSWRALVPNAYRPVVSSLIADIEVGMNGYFRAQTKIVLWVSVLFAIGLNVIDLPFAFGMAILLGLMNYVPYLQLVGLLPALLLSAASSLEAGTPIWTGAVAVLVVFALVQAAQDFYLTPKFMGQFSGFNPAIVLLSLSVWGALLGFIGLVIAIPLTSLLLQRYTRYIRQRELPN